MIDEQLLDDLIFVIEHKAKKVIPQKKIKFNRDSQDAMFLELAVEAKTQFIITGDKDLLSLKKIQQKL